MGRRMPLTLKVPLLMSAILLVVVATAVLASYTALRNSALDRARERLVRSSRQFTAAAAAAISEASGRYMEAARDSVIRGALQDARVNPQPVLRRLAAGDSITGYPVELWTADGRRVAFVGNDVSYGMRIVRGRPLPDRIARALEVAPAGARDSAILTPLYADGDNVLFWFVTPVRDRDRVLGYITHQRRITPTARAQAALRDLIGDSVTVYYRNAEGSFWATSDGASGPTHRNADYATGSAFSPSGERVLFDEERVAETPIVLGMSISEDAIVARNSRTLRQILLLSVALLVGGSVAAWLIGRRLARPIAQMTRAATAMATGDYSTRVPTEGDEEVRQLAEAFNHMASEIYRAQRELEKQTAQARAANSAKSEFLTMMSHELRTPLNAIGGYVELLDMELRGPLTAAQKRDLERIKTSQLHLLGLISGVLDLARVESGKVAYDNTHVPVDPFLAGLDALIEPQAAAKDVSLDYQPCAADLAVFADREKLRQILLNLLSNAIRHTPAGGRVTLRAESAGPRVRITVEDTGPGIPRDRQEEIFEPFVQLDRSLTQPREGLGLGLAISRDLARGMSGELAVDPSNGSGARFVLTLNRGVVDPAASMALSGEARVPGTV